MNPLNGKGVGEQERIAAQIMLADSYYQIKDSQNAEKVLRNIVESESIFSTENSDVVLKYAQVLAANGKYQESRKAYQDYHNLESNDGRGEKFSKLYDDISVLSKNADCYIVDYVTINTDAADFSPSYHQNGLVFVSNRQSTVGVRRVFESNNTPFLDLYYLDDIASLGSTAASLGAGSSNLSKKKTGSLVGSDQYTPPSANDSRTIGSYNGTSTSSGFGYGNKAITQSERFSKDINSKYHEGPTAFFKDGQRVIFTRNNFSNGKARKSSDGINKLKLYIAKADKNGWNNLTELPFNSDEYSTGHPALSPDEQLLFFASDMPGGYGGADIYVSRLDGNNWSPPINLGPKINTKGNEMFPFADDQGNIYFSSNGHPGLGELDIFYQKLDGVSPKGRLHNLGAPLNSSNDDFGIVTDGVRQAGYFSSNRKRGGNDDDIYKFERQCELIEGCELNLALFDSETKMPLDNVIVVYEDNDGNLQEKISNNEGVIVIDNLSEGAEFAFNATREGYSPNTVNFSSEGCDYEPTRLEIPMSIPVIEEVIADEELIGDEENPADEAQSRELSSATTPNTTTRISESGFNSKNSSVSYSSTETSESGYNTSSNTVTCLLSGRVLAQSSSVPIDGVLVTIKSDCDGTLQTAYTDLSGYYEVNVNQGCKYTIVGNKDNLTSQETSIDNLSCNEGGMNSDIYMLGTGDTFLVENIYFNYGKCTIRKDARAGLDKIVTLMRSNPDMEIELSSHTDSRSSSSFNTDISIGRAKASAEYLFKRGVSRSRVQYSGYGESKPINECIDGVDCTSEQHAQNRRTEIKILQMN